MFKWRAKIERTVGEDEVIGFVNRPNVTVGDGFIRLLSLDREILQPSDGISSVVITTEDEDGLLTLLEEVNLGDLMAKALDLREDGDPMTELIGQVISGVVKHARTMDEYAAEVNRRNRGDDA